MLSKKRFKEVRKFLKRNNVNLMDGYPEMYADYCEIVAGELHNKLTTDEIMETTDWMSDLISGNIPQLIVAVQQRDKISTQIRFMEQYPHTKGKLTDDEKLFLAFAVLHAIFSQSYDPETEEVKSGIADFDTREHIMGLFEFERGIYPDMYAFLSEVPAKAEGDFGLSTTNPICAVSVRDEYAYIRRLRYNGMPVFADMSGTLSGGIKGFLDRWTIDIGSETVYLFVDPYQNHNSEDAPAGFTLASI